MIREGFLPGWTRSVWLWLLAGGITSVCLPLRSELLGWSLAYWLLGAPLLVLAVLHWHAPILVSPRVPTAFVACGAGTRA